MTNPTVAMTSLTPILRMFDEAKAKEFYVQFLGFAVDWEHRYEPGFPLYMQVSRGGVRLHLSEHHGDCCPGSAVRIETERLEEFHAGLLAQNYAYARPGLQRTSWGTREVLVTDPFGNRLVFYENID